MRSMSGWLVVVSNATRFGQVTVWEIHTEDGIDYIVVPAVADFYHRKVQEANVQKDMQKDITKNANGKRRGPKIKHGNSVRKPNKVKKVKSLGNFCQQFIRLFVTWKNVISLEEAALRISDGESLDDKMLKTKIRRLYDIANVL